MADVGRPSKYSAETQAKAIDYLFGKYTEVDPKTGVETERFNYAQDGSVIPSIEGLAEWLGVNRSTLYEWESKDKLVEIDGVEVKFSDTLDQILSVQKRVTLNNGLRGVFNSAISKLVLANHGMHDKVDSTLDGSGFNIIIESDANKL